MKWLYDLRAFINCVKYEPKDGMTLNRIEHNMKRFYPGEYHLEWRFDLSASNEVRIVFADDAAEIIWMLKNS